MRRRYNNRDAFALSLSQPSSPAASDVAVETPTNHRPLRVQWEHDTELHRATNLPLGYLVQCSENESNYRIPLYTGYTVVGRDPYNLDLPDEIPQQVHRLDWVGISRNHVVCYMTGDCFMFMHDLESTNGTYLVKGDRAHQASSKAVGLPSHIFFQVLSNQIVYLSSYSFQFVLANGFSEPCIKSQESVDVAVPLKIPCARTLNFARNAVTFDVSHTESHTDTLSNQMALPQAYSPKNADVDELDYSLPDLLTFPAIQSSNKAPLDQAASHSPFSLTNDDPTVESSPQSPLLEEFTNQPTTCPSAFLSRPGNEQEISSCQEHSTLDQAQSLNEIAQSNDTLSSHSPTLIKSQTHGTQPLSLTPLANGNSAIAELDKPLSVTNLTCPLLKACKSNNEGTHDFIHAISQTSTNLLSDVDFDQASNAPALASNETASSQNHSSKRRASKQAYKEDHNIVAPLNNQHSTGHDPLATSKISKEPHARQDAQLFDPPESPDETFESGRKRKAFKFDKTLPNEPKTPSKMIQYAKRPRKQVSTPCSSHSNDEDHEHAAVQRPTSHRASKKAAQQQISDQYGLTEFDVIQSDAMPKTPTSISKKSKSARLSSSIIQSSSTASSDQADVEYSENTVRVMFSMVDRDKYTKIVGDLGGHVVKDWRACDVLIVSQVRRTVKFLCALASGKDILTLDWLNACLKARKWVPRDAYLLKDPSSEQKWGFDLKKSISEARKDRIFKSLTFFVAEGTKPPREEMRALIEAAGGTWLNRAPENRNGGNSKSALIIADEDNQAFVKKYQALKYLVYTTELVLSGILKQELELNCYQIH